MIISPVSPLDAEELLSIYAPFVKDTAVSLEYDVPTAMEFRKRIENITKTYPYLKAVENDKILGFAYAHRFRERKGYDFVAEISLYVSPDFSRHGVGKALYRELESRLSELGIKKMVAVIVSSEKPDEHLTGGSILFHEKTGFRKIGEARDMAYKFGKPYNVLWYEKNIL